MVTGTIWFTSQILPTWRFCVPYRKILQRQTGSGLSLYDFYVTVHKMNHLVHMSSLLARRLKDVMTSSVDTVLLTENSK